MIFYKNGDVDIRDDLHNIIDRYGVSSQVNIAIEEMSELTKALLKDRRNDNNSVKNPNLRYDIIEEIADVSIMLEQLKIIFDCETEVKQQIIYKVERQLDRMKKERLAGSSVSLIDGHIDNTERCVCCGEVIPEGTQYCITCAKGPLESEDG